ncbi:hypothetical protein GGI25_006468 [Coemansia spiralis]|uniref:Uncharacterized protein n=2 Tax=Coemansia TaxID=4863 RepID=A0A9W8KV46_9FUNG|nr:hypothetical protein EDC05_006491 [Coemansia umbellata]KAJ2618539.1 hypothetical protein GGI26_006514 [Coemansia sp. RSA 1358]KAJ2668242.1 hypothetical protein GGI25_006468 [Coemansia spiralis]
MRNRSESNDRALLSPAFSSPSQNEASTEPYRTFNHQSSHDSRIYKNKAAGRRAYVNFILNIPKALLIGTLLTVFVVSYVLALQGGTLVYINEHLGVIGAQVLVSVLSLTIVTVMLYACRMRSTTRRGTLFLVLVTFALLYVYDHGERFEKHGFYNLLVFIAIYMPLNIALAVFYVLWSKIPNFLTYFAVALFVGGLSAGMSLFHYRRVFDNGTFGEFEYLPGECTWVGPNIPFVDLLPAGAQNFWAGPSHCKPEPQRIMAVIDKHGVLHIDCKSDSDVYIDILPETRQWPLWRKSMWNVYNVEVLNDIIRLPYTDKQPFVLNDTTQAVVVRCGTSSKIVTRVGPSIDRLPLYTPPPESDTRNIKSTIEAEAVWLNASSIAHSHFSRPNVIYLMIDAVSRRQFYRRLPRSAKLLKTLHRPGSNRLTELFRHHSVGFSTDNNTRAMYTGEVFPSKPNPLPIWAYYRDRGYITARVETGCDDWAKEYVGGRFESQEYSVGNRSLDYELASPFCLPEFYPQTGNAFGNFKGPYSITARCLYGRYVHDWTFDYLYQLRDELRSQFRDKQSANVARPYMVTAVFLEGHEGTGEVLHTLDKALAAFLKDIRDSGELEDTVFILSADHGLHMGLNFAFLQNGRIEHQNPFFAMSVPEPLYQFAKHYQKLHGNEKVSPFAVNEQRLTTPFETYHTFRALADWPKIDVSNWDRSLFAAQKAGRTCEEAGIGASFCMCKVRP